MTATTRIAVAGAGLIGKRHVDAILAVREAEIACVIDPADAAGDIAARAGAPHVRDLETALRNGGIDGVILATPNHLHAEGALACIAAGLPVLVEKPLASSVDDARRIVAAGEAAGVPVVVGHHRHHNPIIAKARELIAGGALGRIVSVQATTWFYKPPDYFETAWRRKAGAGPIFINLIHDIDLMQHFAGPAREVHAMQSSAVRGFEVEDTAAIILRFASGALGTMNLSDTVTAPWSWEMTAGENPVYPRTTETAYWIGGTRASLSVPNLALWSHPDVRSWWSPIAATNLPRETSDPLLRQVAQFRDVIRLGAAPLVSGRDGLAALAAIEAVKRSADTGAPVRLGAGP